MTDHLGLSGGRQVDWIEPLRRQTERKGMDPNGRIYMEDEEKIPGEDKARLEGYLRAKAEEVELRNMEHIRRRQAEARAEDAERALNEETSEWGEAYERGYKAAQEDANG